MKDIAESSSPISTGLPQPSTSKTEANSGVVPSTSSSSSTSSSGRRGDGGLGGGAGGGRAMENMGATAGISLVPGKGKAGGAVAAPAADGTVKQDEQDGGGQQGKEEAVGGRERSGSVSNFLLSSLNSFSSSTSLSFLAGEDDAITTPETGPAKLDFSTPAHPAMQVVDFIITFLLVRTFLRGVCV